MRIIEKIRFERKIKHTKLTKDPIFIIGGYRTATTFLHTFFSMDKRLAYMSNLDALLPLMNLSFPKSCRRILKRSLPPTRPMDNVELYVDSPQEEHYAIGAKSKYGMINLLIFPQNFEYFAKFLTFEDSHPRDLERWKKVYNYFIKKLTWKYNGKRLVMKNPANAGRIKHLLKMYPNAKFIYTYRNPYTLFCSMRLLLNSLVNVSTLQTWKEEDIEKSMLKILSETYTVFHRDRKLIPPENFYEIKYEDFIVNPMPYIKDIYKKFDLDDFKEVKPILQTYINAKKNYKANNHKLTPRIIRLVNTNWDDYRRDHGYVKLEPSMTIKR